MPPNNSIFYIIKHHSTVHTKQCLYIIPYFRVFCKRVTHIFLKIFIAGCTRRFPAPGDRGARTAAGVFALTGRLLFLHRLSGVLELRQRVRPNGAESFSLNLSGGDSPSADGGSVAAPAAGTTPYPRRWAKRKDNLRFSFLFELLPFPCFLIWRRFPICDRSEKGYGRGFFLPYLSQPVRSVRYITATQIRKPPLGAA